LEVKTKRGLNVIEKNIDEQIETMTRVGFIASTLRHRLFFKSLAFSKKSHSLPAERSRKSKLYEN